MVDLSGSWLGTYWQFAHPTRFQMVIVQGRSVLDGNILDDNQLGDASLTGAVTANSVQFTKRYLTFQTPPILYSGEIQADGQVMRGRWRILAKGLVLLGGSGNWEAKRSGDPLVLDTKISTLVSSQ